MHEMAAVHNVVDIVVEQAQELGISEVSVVHLTIGQGRDIVESFFGELFTYLARGTVAEHAEVVITWIPVTLRCNNCNFVFPINLYKNKPSICPSCKEEKGYVVNSGMEFSVSHIEVALKENDSEVADRKAESTVATA